MVDGWPKPGGLNRAPNVELEPMPPRLRPIFLVCPEPKYLGLCSSSGSRSSRSTLSAYPYSLPRVRVTEFLKTPDVNTSLATHIWLHISGFSYCGRYFEFWDSGCVFFSLTKMFLLMKIRMTFFFF